MKHISILAILLLSFGLTSSIKVDNKIVFKATLGGLKVNLTENGSVFNKIRNSFGESKDDCFSGYTGTLENQMQDTMVFVAFNMKTKKGADCSQQASVTDVIKVGTYKLGRSGASGLGSTGSITVKIQDKYYSTSLADQPEGKFMKVTSVTPYTGPALYDMTNDYKKKYLVKGTASVKLFNAMVKDDAIESSDIQFNLIFAE